jgi:hypothetical protein
LARFEDVTTDLGRQEERTKGRVDRRIVTDLAAACIRYLRFNSQTVITAVLVPFCGESNFAASLLIKPQFALFRLLIAVEIRPVFLAVEPVIPAIRRVVRLARDDVADVGVSDGLAEVIAGLHSDDHCLVLHDETFGGRDDHLELGPSVFLYFERS